MSKRPSSRVSKKFTWGRTVLAAVFTVVALWTPAEADQRGGKNHKQTQAHKPAKLRHAKLDLELNDRADGVGDSDVIVEFDGNSDGASNINGAGGRAGRRLRIINGYSGRISNALLKRLANDPKVKRIHVDRETEAFVARTAAAIGVNNIRAQYGYTGAGIGVAVIDSGITSWHDDLTVANHQGQRVTAFVDFVNGRTTKYDDWGHGTHVAGHHRRQRLRLFRFAVGHRARRQHHRPQGPRQPGQGPHQRNHRGPRLGSRPTRANTTSASSTCRSARACSRATPPTR